MKLLDRWKVLISGISLLPMAGTTLAQAGHLSLADANWQPKDKLQPRYCRYAQCARHRQHLCGTSLAQFAPIPQFAQFSLQRLEWL